VEQEAGRLAWILDQLQADAIVNINDMILVVSHIGSEFGNMACIESFGRDITEGRLRQAARRGELPTFSLPLDLDGARLLVQELAPDLLATVVLRQVDVIPILVVVNDDPQVLLADIKFELVDAN